MKKMKLEAETLSVETFSIGDTGERAGTVQACEMLATRPGVCDPFSLPPRCA